MNKAKFYTGLRTRVGALSQTQVDGNEAILNEFENHPSLTRPQMAYILATAYHEVDKKMQPIREYDRGGNRAYAVWKTNSKGVKYCFKDRRRTDVYVESEYPFIYYGRGFVQLTWWNNYDKMGKRLNVDLVNNPDLAMDINIAAKVLVVGMLEGTFTGYKLGRAVNASGTNFLLARKVVNGTDANIKIAGYAQMFLSILNAA